MASSVLLYFLALGATATFAQTPMKWTRLKVTITSPGILRFVTGFSFYTMPLTTDEASKEGWAQAASTNLTTIWCWEEDPRVCMLYDSQGTVAGMQISFPVADIVFPGNDSVENHPLLFRNNMYNTELYSARFYLVDQATLAAGGRPPSKEVGTGLWLQSGPDLVEVPRDGDLLEAQSWTRMYCGWKTGRHYFYNMNNEMSCEDLQPYFLLVNDKDNSLHGLGLRMIGRPSIKSRKWFDAIPRRDIKEVTQNAPSCLKNLAKEYGIFFFHLYFVSNPYSTLCSPSN